MDYVKRLKDKIIETVTQYGVGIFDSRDIETTEREVTFVVQNINTEIKPGQVVYVEVNIYLAK